MPMMFAGEWRSPAAQPSYGTPPYAPTRNEFEADQVQPIRLADIGSGLPDVSTLPTRRPGFLAEGGAGRSIAGAIGDALLTLGGQAPVFAPAMQQRRQLALEETRYQRERRDRQTDWQTQQAWRLAHPDDQFTQYLTAAGIDPQSTQGQALYRQRAESMATPPTVAVDGFDAQGNPTKTFMPRTGFTGGGQSAPVGPAVGTIKNGYRFAGGNPNDRNSWVPVGGASSSGGATFR